MASTQTLKKPSYVNWNSGTYPWFQDMLRARITRGFNTILNYVGFAGVGKSYAALTTGEEMDDTFNIERVTFFPNEFIRVTQEMKKGQYVMIDEPAIAGVLGKRTWYTEMQQAIIDVLETFRFQNLTVMLCCINTNLLDAIVRNYLIHYRVIMKDRGYGQVYSVDPSQFDSTIRTPFEGEIYLELPSDTLLRAYEDKRRQIQKSRYLKSLNEMEQQEVARETFSQTLARAKERRQELKDSEGKYSVAKIRELLGVGKNKAYDILKLLNEMDESPNTANT